MSTVNEEPASGKVYIFVVGIILLILGMIDLGLGIFTLYDGHGYFIGGVYAGIVTVILCYATRPAFLVNRGKVGYLLCFSILNAIVALVALIECANDKNFLNDLQACGDFSTCSGDENYCNAVGYCELSYLANHNNQEKDNLCICYSTRHDGECYEYDNVPNCSQFLSFTPKLMNYDLWLALAIFVMTIVLGCFVCFSRCCPSFVETKSELRLREQQDLSSNGPMTPMTTNTSPYLPPAPQNPSYSPLLANQVYQPLPSSAPPIVYVDAEKF